MNQTIRPTKACWLAIWLAISLPLLAEFPEAPKPAKQYALNVGTTERYSFTKSDFEVSPFLGLDYRIRRDIRVAVTYNQSFVQTDFFGWPRLNSSVSVGVNYKIKEWGKAK